MYAVAQKTDYVKQAYEVIRDAIMSGDLPPGAPLAQEELASRLGVSRQPVSHALLLLRHEGLVTGRGRKGQMVAPIDAGRLLALYQLRGAMDRLAATLAAGRIAAATVAGAALEAALQRGQDALRQGGINDLVAADVGFHQTLYALSGNDEIAGAADSFWPHMVRSMRLVLEEAAGRADIWAEHAAIAAAVLAGETERAGQLAEAHARRAGEATHARLTA